jgi:hypothetical protein
MRQCGIRKLQQWQHSGSDSKTQYRSVSVMGTPTNHFHCLHDCCLEPDWMIAPPLPVSLSLSLSWTHVHTPTHTHARALTTHCSLFTAPRCHLYQKLIQIIHLLLYVTEILNVCNSSQHFYYGDSLAEARERIRECPISISSMIHPFYYCCEWHH